MRYNPVRLGVGTALMVGALVMWIFLFHTWGSDLYFSIGSPELLPTAFPFRTILSFMAFLGYWIVLGSLSVDQWSKAVLNLLITSAVVTVPFVISFASAQPEMPLVARVLQDMVMAFYLYPIAVLPSLYFSLRGGIFRIQDNGVA